MTKSLDEWGNEVKTGASSIKWSDVLKVLAFMFGGPYLMALGLVIPFHWWGPKADLFFDQHPTLTVCYIIISAVISTLLMMFWKPNFKCKCDNCK